MPNERKIAPASRSLPTEPANASILLPKDPLKKLTPTDIANLRAMGLTDEDLESLRRQGPGLVAPRSGFKPLQAGGILTPTDTRPGIATPPDALPTKPDTLLQPSLDEVLAFSQTPEADYQERESNMTMTTALRIREAFVIELGDAVAYQLKVSSRHDLPEPVARVIRHLGEHKQGNSQSLSLLGFDEFQRPKDSADHSYGPSPVEQVGLVLSELFFDPGLDKFLGYEQGRLLMITTFRDLLQEYRQAFLLRTLPEMPDLAEVILEQLSQLSMPLEKKLRLELYNCIEQLEIPKLLQDQILWRMDELGDLDHPLATQLTLDLLKRDPECTSGWLREQVARRDELLELLSDPPESSWVDNSPDPNSAPNTGRLRQLILRSLIPPQIELTSPPSSVFERYYQISNLRKKLVLASDLKHPQTGRIGLEFEFEGGRGHQYMSESEIGQEVQFGDKPRYVGKAHADRMAQGYQLDQAGFEVGKDRAYNSEIRRILDPDSNLDFLTFDTAYRHDLATLSRFLNDVSDHISSVHVHLDMSQHEHKPLLGDLLYSATASTITPNDLKTWEIRALLVPFYQSGVRFNPATIIDAIELYINVSSQSSARPARKQTLPDNQTTVSLEQALWGHICAFISDPAARLSALSVIQDELMLRSINPATFLRTFDISDYEAFFGHLKTECYSRDAQMLCDYLAQLPSDWQVTAPDLLDKPAPTSQMDMFRYLSHDAFTEAHRNILASSDPARRSTIYSMWSYNPVHYRKLFKQALQTEDVPTNLQQLVGQTQLDSVYFQDEWRHMLTLGDELLNEVVLFNMLSSYEHFEVEVRHLFKELLAAVKAEAYDQPAAWLLSAQNLADVLTTSNVSTSFIETYASEIADIYLHSTVQSIDDSCEELMSYQFELFESTLRVAVKTGKRLSYRQISHMVRLETLFFEELMYLLFESEKAWPADKKFISRHIPADVEPYSSYIKNVLTKDNQTEQNLFTAVEITRHHSLLFLPELVVLLQKPTFTSIKIAILSDVTVQRELSNSPELIQTIVQLALANESKALTAAATALMRDVQLFESYIPQLLQADYLETRLAAIDLMSYSPSSYVTELVSLANTNPDSTIRTRAVSCFDMNQPAFKSALLELTRDENMLIRSSAVQRLNPQDSEHQLILLSAAQYDASPEVRQSALTVLREVADQFANVFITAMQDPQPEVRVAAAYATVFNQDELAAHLIQLALHDPDVRVQSECISIMGMSNNPEVYGQTLLALTHSSDVKLRIQTLQAFSTMNIEPAYLSRLKNRVYAETNQTVLERLFSLMKLDIPNCIPELTYLIREEHIPTEIRSHALYLAADFGPPLSDLVEEFVQQPNHELYFTAENCVDRMNDLGYAWAPAPINLT